MKMDAKKKRKGENKKLATFPLFCSVYQQLTVSVPALFMLVLFHFLPFPLKIKTSVCPINNSSVHVQGLLLCSPPVRSNQPCLLYHYNQHRLPACFQIHVQGLPVFGCHKKFFVFMNGISTRNLCISRAILNHCHTLLCSHLH